MNFGCCCWVIGLGCLDVLMFYLGLFFLYMNFCSPLFVRVDAVSLSLLFYGESVMTITFLGGMLTGGKTCFCKY